MIPDNKDQILYNGLKAGGEDTYKVLFEEYYLRLVIFAQKYLIDLDLSREIVQEFFVHLYEQRETLSIQTSLKSYFYQSVRNRCLNMIKKQSVRQTHHETIKRESAEAENEYSDRMVETELANQIHYVVSNLPVKCRQVYQLSRHEGLSNKEISEKLNLSVRTVETHISNALKVLREKLADYI